MLKFIGFVAFITVTVVVGHPNAQSVTCPFSATAAADGCAAAAAFYGPNAGAPQYPTILNRYGPHTQCSVTVPGSGPSAGGPFCRPPWNVAGVDYYVGAAIQTLTDWQLLKTDSHWIWNGAFLRCANGTPVLNGVDFTTGSIAYSIYVPQNGCTGLTITNSKLGCIPGAGSTAGLTWINMQPNGTFNFVFKNNTVDYANCQATGPNQSLPTSGFWAGFVSPGTAVGSVDIEYNYFRDLVGDPGIWGGGNISPFIYSHNVFDTYNTSWPGCGSTTPGCIHANVVSFSGMQASNGMHIDYNLMFMAHSYSGGEGPQVYDQANPPQNSWQNVSINNNVFPFQACNCVSYTVHGTGVTHDVPHSVVNGSVANNYLDPTGTFGFFYPNSISASLGWTNESGDIDMTTGLPTTGSVTPVTTSLPCLC